MGSTGEAINRFSKQTNKQTNTELFLEMNEPADKNVLDCLLLMTVLSHAGQVAGGIPHMNSLVFNYETSGYSSNFQTINIGSRLLVTAGGKKSEIPN